jgi:hypothetical protein
VVNHDKTGQVGSPNDAWAQTKPQCALVTEDVVGPYYYPGELVRSDIHEGLPGVPMLLEVQLMDVSTCQPIQQMTVDIWAVSSNLIPWPDLDADFCARPTPMVTTAISRLQPARPV